MTNKILFCLYNATKKINSYNRISCVYYNTEVKHSTKFDPKSHVIDMRSETVTLPSKEMKQVMHEAILGDDVHQEDETVLALERKMCELTGKEAALYVSSGTMGNLLCLLSHCKCRGSEVIVGNRSHIFHCEQANFAQFGGIQACGVATNTDGTIDLPSIEAQIRVDDFHYAKTEAICIEQTHGDLGGKVVPLEWIDQVCSLAHSHHLPVHLDGARIFNASIASKIPPSRFLQNCSSASICLSKGLGAPVGSVLVGGKDFVDRARRLRKALGGGWRQAGIIAAGGLYSLNNNIQRLQSDHDKAKKFAQGINACNSGYASVDLSATHTNMVLMDLDKNVITPEAFCKRLEQTTTAEMSELGVPIIIRSFPHTQSSIRFVLHLNVGEEDVEEGLKKMNFVFKEFS